MDDAFAAGDRFLLNQARLLERRIFAACFLGQPAAGVVDALRGYQNADGGFGHALEPDKRCPASLPIDVETAFQALAIAGTVDRDMVIRGCDFLARVAAEAGADGAVPPAFPVIESFPRAAHWTEWTYQPGLNPTAGLVGLLYQLGVDHPWRSAGAAYCWQQLGSGGLSPLDIAPLASSRWRSLFTVAQIDAHLDRLQKDQQADGGWPITWEPPSQAAVAEWRGVVTLAALRTLTSYGRLTGPAPGSPRSF